MGSDTPFSRSASDASVNEKGKPKIYKNLVFEWFALICNVYKHIKVKKYTS